MEPFVDAKILTTKDDLRVLTNTNEMSMEGAMVMPNDKMHYNGDACKWLMLNPKTYSGKDLHFSPTFVATIFGHTILREARAVRDANQDYEFMNPTTAVLTSGVYRFHCNRHDLEVLPNCERLIDELNKISPPTNRAVLANAIQELDQ